MSYVGRTSLVDSFAIRLILLICLPFFLLIGSAVYFINSTAADAEQASRVAEMANSATRSTREIDANYRLARSISRDLAAALSSGMVRNRESSNAFAGEILKQNRFLAASYILFRTEQAESIDGSMKDGDRYLTSHWVRHPDNELQLKLQEPANSGPEILGTEPGEKLLDTPTIGDIALNRYETVVRFVDPVFVDGEMLGITGVDLATESLNELLKIIAGETGAEAFLIHQNGHYIASSAHDRDLRLLKGAHQEEASQLLAMLIEFTVGEMHVAQDPFLKTEKIFFSAQVGTGNWRLVLRYPETKFNTSLWQQTWFSFPFFIGIFFLGIFLSLVSWFMSQRFRKAHIYANAISTGLMDVVDDVENPGRDEIGQLIAEFRSILDFNRKMLGVLKEIAVGKYTSRVTKRGPQDPLADLINEIAENKEEDQNSLAIRMNMESLKRRVATICNHAGSFEQALSQSIRVIARYSLTDFLQVFEVSNSPARSLIVTEVHYVVANCEFEPTNSNQRVKEGDGFLGRVLANPTVKWVELQPDRNADLQWLQESGFVGALAMPIFCVGELVAVILVAGKSPLTKNDVVLSAVTEICAELGAAKLRINTLQNLVQLTHNQESILEKTPDYIYVTDADYKIVAMSQSLAIALNFRHWQQLVGEPASEVFALSADQFIEDDQLILSGQRSRIDEPREWTLNGEQVYLETIRTPILEGKEVSGAVALLRDVTREKKALELAESRSGQVRELLENSPDATIYCDTEGKITFVNAQFRKLFGYSDEEAIGQKIEMLIPSKYHGAHVGQRQSFMNEPLNRDMATRGTLQAIDKNGRTFPVEVNLSPTKTSEGQVITASIRDVSARVEAQAEITKNEQRFRSLFEGSRDALLLATSRFELIDCNEVAVRLFGADSKEQLMSIDLLNFLQFDLEDEGGEFVRKENRRESVNQAMVEGLVVFEDSYLGFKGRQFFSETSISAVDIDKEKLLFISIRDISERRKHEEEIKAARITAEVATESKSNFLAAMSHEIRTPINGIMGMAELLSQTDLDQDQQHMVKTIQDSRSSLLTIINDILDFSKMEAGKLEVESTAMSIADGCEQVSQTICSAATEKGVFIHLFIDPEIPESIMGDPHRLQQIMLNLLSNAVKFSNGHDVQFHALISEKQESFLRIRIEVIDKGIGIAEDGKKKLFQAFSQAEESTTRKYGGTGLGLVICQRLLELMGGEIGVESKEGEGSTFWFELNMDLVTDSVTTETPPDLSGLSIVLLGATAPRADSIGRYLAHFGVKTEQLDVDSLCDIKTRTNQPDAVMLDFDLSEEKQMQVVERIREMQPGGGRLPLIGLQNYGRRDARIVSPDIVFVDANPLIRSRIVNAVAVAAGRLVPAPTATSNTEIESAKVVHSVKSAENAGQLILLVEDNLTNQDVMNRQLKLLGCACVIANDGVEGLREWESGRYGLVLTDCHMPEMDGYQLTAKIREKEGVKDQHTPIIAVTASALKKEADRCMAAGMDDYLTKPLALSDLKAALEKWLPGFAGSSELYQPAEQPLSTDCLEHFEGADEELESPIDLSALTDLFGSDRTTINEILKSFVEPSAENVRDIVQSWEQHSAVGVREGSHKLKSSAKAIGANVLADACLTLEQAGWDDDWDTIDDLAPKLDSYLQTVAFYIERL